MYPMAAIVLIATPSKLKIRKTVVMTKTLLTQRRSVSRTVVGIGARRTITTVKVHGLHGWTVRYLAEVEQVNDPL